MLIEFDEECKLCKGTGLYKGMAERDSFAVVCHTCKGTGCHHFKYTYALFNGRKESTKVVRVLQTNPGIIVGTGRSGLTSESFGGLTYEDWKAGKPFTSGTEMRDFVCPKWWYQSTDYSKAPDWRECNQTLGCSFSSCKSFPTKEECWKRFDNEQT